VTGAIALMIVFGTPFVGDNWGFAFPVPLLLIGLVVLAIFATRDQRRRAGPVPPPPWGSAPPAAPGAPTPTYAQEGSTMSSTATRTDPYTPADWQTAYGTGQQPPAWMPPPPSSYVPPPRPRRTGLVLFWPTLALIAIGLGTLGIVDVDGAVTLSAYAALALAVTAVMLLVGAFVGRPGGLIALGLTATLALAITSGIDAATDGGAIHGEHLVAAPTSAALVHDSYLIPNGQLTLDLTRVSDLAALDGRTIDVQLKAGEVDVILPPGLNADVVANMHVAGGIVVGSSERDGFDQTLSRSLAGSTATNAPTIDLNVDARVGQISVHQR
jgi:hypothetical protein